MSDMEFTAAEQSARILDGEVVRLGDAWVSSTTPPSAQLRTASLAFELSLHVVLSHAVAAWVHGCHGFPNSIDVTVQAHHRRGIPSDPRIRVRRLRLDFRHDTEVIGAVRVTTPTRTALHLLADEGCDRADLTAAMLLCGGRSRLESAVATAERVTERSRRAMTSRLERLQPLVTL